MKTYGQHVPLVHGVVHHSFIVNYPSQQHPNTAIPRHICCIIFAINTTGCHSLQYKCGFQLFRIRLGIFIFFSLSTVTVNKSHKKKRSKQKSVQPRPHILFLSAIELNCHPKRIKNTSLSHTVALANMVHHYQEHQHSVILRQSHEQYKTMAEKSPAHKQIH